MRHFHTVISLFLFFFLSFLAGNVSAHGDHGVELSARDIMRSDASLSARSLGFEMDEVLETRSLLADISTRELYDEIKARANEWQCIRCNKWFTHANLLLHRKKCK
ncbi:hypothetical protein FA15DRAFT_760286 [Coprinopsis marcescibilis]|uniref:C2H2-type domain-containing protein n=1 Tax=Coprinopsis marcescibilis TaxID=230819 RepID=A0A5C3KFV5_COPMA|nr:hypothetical protein FA15DRAFT_760286 [Coprinopsis marcescibilis]